MSTTTPTTIRHTGRVLAEQILRAIDDKALSVADVAMTAGLPVPQVEDLLHAHPERLDLGTALILADALGVRLSTLVERAQQVRGMSTTTLGPEVSYQTVWGTTERKAACRRAGCVTRADRLKHTTIEGADYPRHVHGIRQSSERSTERPWWSVSLIASGDEPWRLQVTLINNGNQYMPLLPEPEGLAAAITEAQQVRDRLNAS